jgi:tetratricopeptide (TPR) repeat protein
LSRRLVSDGPPQTRAGAPDAVGNTYFVLGEFHPALDQYTQVLGFSPDDYYALASAAQSYQALGDPVAAGFFARCLSAIEDRNSLQRLPVDELGRRRAVSPLSAAAPFFRIR